MIGIPFYVWDLSEQFHEDVVEDFLAEYAEGRTPNPCLRCNEKIKFAAVLDRALALGFDAVATGHYAQLRTGADGLIEMHRAEDMGKDQSYVLGVLTQDQLAHSLFPLGDTPKPEVAREADRRGLRRRRQAGQPRHLLHQRRRHRRLALARSSATSTAAAHRRRRRRGPRRARGLLALHDRPAQGPAASARPAADGQPRYVLDIEPVSGTVTVGPRAALTVDGLDGDPAALVRHRPGGAAGVHGAAARPRRRAPRGRRRRDEDSLSRRAPRPRRRASPPARPSWCTTAPGSSARPRSRRPRRVDRAAAREATQVTSA